MKVTRQKTSKALHKIHGRPGVSIGAAGEAAAGGEEVHTQISLDLARVSSPHP